MKISPRSNRLARSMLWAVAACMPVVAQAPPLAKAGQETPAAARQVERGRYLVLITGCNDCHTPGYGASGGKVAEQDWLVGDTLGYSGPWGTTYPTNLRLLAAGMTEAQWLALAQPARDATGRPEGHLPLHHPARPQGQAGSRLPAAGQQASRTGGGLSGRACSCEKRWSERRELGRALRVGAEAGGIRGLPGFRTHRSGCRFPMETFCHLPQNA